MGIERMPVMEDQSMALSIFVGSSSEKRPLAARIAKELSENGYQPLRWWEGFPLGSITLDQLSVLSRQVAGAVFVFGNDDKVWYRGKEQGAPRDNVLLEYGLFLNNLDRRRCIIVKDQDSRLPSDLHGITYQPTGYDETTVAEEIVKHFNSVFADRDLPALASIPSLIDPQIVVKQTQEQLPSEWFQRTLYLGVTCARRWLDVTRSVSGSLRQHQRYVDRNVVDMAQTVRPLTFVSFGPGDGELDRDIAAALSRSVPSIQYIPVDICQGLLNHAARVVGEHVRIPIALVGDFEDGIGFIKKQLKAYVRAPSLIALLGNTFGNLDSFEGRFLDSMHTLMASETD